MNALMNAETKKIHFNNRGHPPCRQAGRAVSDVRTFFKKCRRLVESRSQTFRRADAPPPPYARGARGGREVAERLSLAMAGWGGGGKRVLSPTRCGCVLPRCATDARLRLRARRTTPRPRGAPTPRPCPGLPPPSSPLPPPAFLPASRPNSRRRWEAHPSLCRHVSLLRLPCWPLPTRLLLLNSLLVPPSPTPLFSFSTAPFSARTPPTPPRFFLVHDPSCRPPPSTAPPPPLPLHRACRPPPPRPQPTGFGHEAVQPCGG